MKALSVEVNRLRQLILEGTPAELAEEKRLIQKDIDFTKYLCEVPF